MNRTSMNVFGSSGCGRREIRSNPRFSDSSLSTTQPYLLRRLQRLQADEGKRLLPVHRWLKTKLADLTFDVDRALSIISGMVPDADSGIDVDTYRERRAMFG